MTYNYLFDFELAEESLYTEWVAKIIASEEAILGEIAYIFCDDQYLLGINQQYLNHNTLTDIITFDYTNGKVIGGDIFISIDRVKENAGMFKVSFIEELLRVMAHGVLHLLGYKDKTDEEAQLMRFKEVEKIKLFHVER